MTKLLLNTGLVPLYNKHGAPIPSGGIVLDEELDEATEESVVLVHVKPGDLPESHAHLSAAARKHLRGNADARSGDDAGVKQSTSKGGQS